MGAAIVINNLSTAPQLISKNRSSITGILATAALPILVFAVFRDLRLAGIVLVGALWFAASYNASIPAEWRYSACRIYLPVFFCYNAISLLSPDLRNRSLIAWGVFLAGVSFLIAWLVFAPIRNVSSPQASGSPAKVAIKFHLPLFWTIAVVTVGVYTALVIRAGILPAFSNDPSLTRTLFFPSGYFATLIVMGVHIMAFVGIVWLVSDRTRRLQGLFVWVTALFLGYGTGNRGIIFIPLLLGGLVLGYSLKINISRAVPWIILAISGFSMLGYARGVRSHGVRAYAEYLQGRGYSGVGEYFSPILNYIYATAETFDRTSRVIPDSVGFAWGGQFFSPILLRQSVDLYLKSILGDTFSGFGLATGGVNAFYIDWGIPGIVVGFFIMGSVAAVLFRRALLRQDPRSIVMYCYFLSMLFLSNYGHPFAYLYYIVEPAILYFLVRDTIGVGADVQSRLGPGARTVINAG